jgi:hypothetical protein
MLGNRDLKRLAFLPFRLAVVPTQMGSLLVRVNRP